MALGTPVAGAVAYTISTGDNINAPYPTGIGAGDVLILFVAQKPAVANGGVINTPTGWTERDALFGAGGYGTTLGADTGNTNMKVFTKNVVTGSETGNLLTTVTGNGIAWGFIVLVPAGAGTISYGTADGQRTTTPTSPMSIALTNGTSATNFQAGDVAVWAMCIPTDVTTPSQFSAQSITATGATFGTAVELNEPDSQSNNDIGGYSAYAACTAGSSTTAPTVTTNLTGTLTNVRGPVLLIRVRETAPPSQSLTQSARFDNTNSFFSPALSKSNTLNQTARYDNDNTFYSATVTPGAETLVQTARYDNTSAFYSPDVTQTGGAQTLTPARYDNTNAFYSAAATSAYALAPARYDNTNAFYSATVGRGAVNLQPARYDNANTFYSATVTPGAVTLAPALFTEANAFYTAVVSQSGGPQFLLPDRYDNANTVYSATLTNFNEVAPSRYDNANTFYTPDVEVQAINLQPARYNNTNAFYSPSASQMYYLRFEDYVDPGYVDPGYIGLDVQGDNYVFTPQLIPGPVDIAPLLFTNSNTFFRPTLRARYVLAPARLTNTNTIYSATALNRNRLQPPRVDNVNVFYSVAVSYPQDVAPPLVGSTNVFFTARVAPGPVNLAPALFTNQNTIYAARIARPVYPALFVNQNTIYPPGAVYDQTLAPALFVNRSVFYSLLCAPFPWSPGQRHPLAPGEVPRQALTVDSIDRQALPSDPALPRQQFPSGGSLPRQPLPT